MPGRQCYHCKQWVDEGEAHDCWTTTEAALTRDLSEDLQEAYERLRDAAIELGEQRVYASHHSIMFSRKSCYFFVRPKKSYLEVVLFLGRPVRAPQIKRVENPSRAKVANIIHVRHRDEVEAPLTDWLQEAYELPDRMAAAAAEGRVSRTRPKATAKRPAAAKRVKAKAKTAGKTPAAAKKTPRKTVSAKKKGARGARR